MLSWLTRILRPFRAARGASWAAIALGTGCCLVIVAGCEHGGKEGTGTIRALVEDTTGAHVVGATIWVQSHSAEGMTDESGRVALGDVPPGDQIIWGERYGVEWEGGSLVGSRAVTVEGSAAIDVLLRLARGNTRHPRASILEPSLLAYEQGDSLLFWGRVGDFQDANEGLEATWTSSIDSLLYRGKADSLGFTYFRRRLSAGQHRVELRVTDSEGLIGIDSIRLAIR